ncbi:HET-domain-containing protein [Microthyrium microscopicum]|uniref:HET-domain-containing protein n=1 Tax=Microthyrium microscopicum TaxID=703497 RepID=A0A6A6U1H9_9PEZI|nr:HET-domain-containing protein [Microthyrium microscopicum]
MNTSTGTACSPSSSETDWNHNLLLTRSGSDIRTLPSIEEPESCLTCNTFRQALERPKRKDSLEFDNYEALATVTLGQLEGGVGCPQCQQIVRYFQSNGVHKYNSECVLSLMSFGNDAFRLHCQDAIDFDNDVLLLSHSRSLNDESPYDPEFTKEDLVERREETPEQYFVTPDRFEISVAQLRQWISYCNGKHQGACLRPGPSTTSHPRLAIDVFSSCLETIATPIQYVALSYVWGSNQNSAGVFETDLQSLEALQIPGAFERSWTKVPATVKDAILLTKALGIRYLWVDRFCIIQNDKKRKDEDIGSMDAIYSQAYFTIIAANGRDAEHGLRGIPNSSSGTRDFEPIFRYGKQDYGCVTVPSERSSTWHSRGWTFQERALSRRSLVFYDQTVKWECLKGSFHEHLGSIHTAIDIPVDSHDESARHRVSAQLWPDMQQYRNYCNSYSKRQLTKQEDAERAFGAIITTCSSSFPGGILYGLPEFVFDIALAWSHVKVDGRRKEFPSWSWLGWKGQIDMEEWTVHHSASGRILHRRMVQWKKQNENMRNEDFANIDNTYHKWEQWATNTTDDPPEGWERRLIKKEPHYYKVAIDESSNRKERLLFGNPVPLVSSRAPRRLSQSPWSLYIFAAVDTAKFVLKQPARRGLFKSHDDECVEVMVHDLHDSWAGTLKTNIPSAHYEAGKECLLIAIHHGSIPWITASRSAYPEVAQFQVEPDTEFYKDRYEYVQVLWIKLENGVAYRHGAGRIWANSWYQQTIERMDIKLG